MDECTFMGMKIVESEIVKDGEAFVIAPDRKYLPPPPKDITSYLIKKALRGEIYKITGLTTKEEKDDE